MSETPSKPQLATLTVEQLHAERKRVDTSLDAARQQKRDLKRKLEEIDDVLLEKDPSIMRKTLESIICDFKSSCRDIDKPLLAQLDDVDKILRGVTRLEITRDHDWEYGGRRWTRCSFNYDADDNDDEIEEHEIQVERHGETAHWEISLDDVASLDCFKHNVLYEGTHIIDYLFRYSNP